MVYSATHLPQEACGAAVDEGHGGRKAHAVDVSARSEVVQCVEHEREALEEGHVEVLRGDAAVVRGDARGGAQGLGGGAGDLNVEGGEIPRWKGRMKKRDRDDIRR